MVSRTKNEGTAATLTVGNDGDAVGVRMPRKIVDMILAELRNGVDPDALAKKYGVPLDAINAWREARDTQVSGGQSPPRTAEVTSETASPPESSAATSARSTGRFSREFKQEVVAQVAAGRPKSEVAAQYGVGVSNVYRWVKEAKGNNGTVPDPKSTKPPTNASPIDEEHRRLVLELKESRPNMGPAQIQHNLRRFHAIKISRHMIGRIFADAGIPLQKVGSTAAEKEAAENRFEMSRPNELWAVDFKEFWVHAEKVYALFVLDDYSRYCVGHAVTQEATADLAIATVNAAIQRYGRPERILSDRGPQFHAWNGVSRFDAFLGEFLTDHTVTKARHAYTNGKLEAFNRTVDEELLLVMELESVKEAQIRIAEFVATYNFARTHSSLDGLIPADRYFGMVEEARAALLHGLAKAGPGLKWLGQLVSQDGPGMRVPSLLQVLVRDDVLELVVLGRRFQLG